MGIQSLIAPSQENRLITLPYDKYTLVKTSNGSASMTSGAWKDVFSIGDKGGWFKYASVRVSGSMSSSSYTYSLTDVKVRVTVDDVVQTEIIVPSLSWSAQASWLDFSVQVSRRSADTEGNVHATNWMMSDVATQTPASDRCIYLTNDTYNGTGTSVTYAAPTQGNSVNHGLSLNNANNGVILFNKNFKISVYAINGTNSPGVNYSYANFLGGAKL